MSSLDCVSSPDRKSKSSFEKNDMFIVGEEQHEATPAEATPPIEILDEQESTVKQHHSK